MEQAQRSTQSPERAVNIKPDLSSSSESSDDEQRSGSRSPPPNCPICLCRCKDKCFTDSCLHQFCFKCLLEWSKVKAECPLCKQTFKSIIHNVKSIDQFEEYLVQPPRWNLSATVSTGAVYNEAIFSQARNRLYSGWNEFLENSFRYNRHRRNNYATRGSFQFNVFNPTSQRINVYERGLYANPTSDITGTFRECSARFYRNNPAQIHRLVPWLEREIVCARRNNDDVTLILHTITQLLTVYDLHSPEFRRRLTPYFGTRTQHFLHELYRFASSPFDMHGYDRHVRYQTAEIVISSSSNTSSASEHEDNDNDSRPLLGLTRRGPNNNSTRTNRTDTTTRNFDNSQFEFSQSASALDISRPLLSSNSTSSSTTTITSGSSIDQQSSSSSSTIHPSSSSSTLTQSVSSSSLITVRESPLFNSPAVEDSNENSQIQQPSLSSTLTESLDIFSNTQQSSSSSITAENLNSNPQNQQSLSSSSTTAENLNSNLQNQQPLSSSSTTAENLNSNTQNQQSLSLPSITARNLNSDLHNQQSLPLPSITARNLNGNSQNQQSLSLPSITARNLNSNLQNQQSLSSSSIMAGNSNDNSSSSVTALAILNSRLRRLLCSSNIFTVSSVVTPAQQNPNLQAVSNYNNILTNTIASAPIGPQLPPVDVIDVDTTNNINQNITLSSSTSSDECQFVLERKPPHLRTPELVNLNSDPDSDVVFVSESKSRTVPAQPRAIASFKLKRTNNPRPCCSYSTSSSDEDIVPRPSRKFLNKRMKTSNGISSRRPTSSITAASTNENIDKKMILSNGDASKNPTTSTATTSTNDSLDKKLILPNGGASKISTISIAATSANDNIDKRMISNRSSPKKLTSFSATTATDHIDKRLLNRSTSSTINTIDFKTDEGAGPGPSTLKRLRRREHYKSKRRIYESSSSNDEDEDVDVEKRTKYQKKFEYNTDDYTTELFLTPESECGSDSSSYSRRKYSKSRRHRLQKKRRSGDSLSRRSKKRTKKP